MTIDESDRKGVWKLKKNGFVMSLEVIHANRHSLQKNILKHPNEKMLAKSSKKGSEFSFSLLTHLTVGC